MTETLLQKAVDGHDESIYELMIKHGKVFPASPKSQCWQGNKAELTTYLKDLAGDLERANGCKQEN